MLPRPRREPDNAADGRFSAAEERSGHDAQGHARISSLETARMAQ